MHEIKANRPNTRARVEARRRARRDSTPPRPSQPEAAPAAKKAEARRPAQRTSGSAQVRTGPRLVNTRRHLKASLAAPSDVLQRVRSSARARMGSRGAYTGSRVRPGPRKMFLEWIVSGRLISLGLFLVSIVALVYLFVSPRFRVQQIQVEGNSVLQSDIVASLSGLPGASVWFANTSLAVERVLQNAYIEDASISVFLPNLAVIKVAERRPEVRWAVGNLQYLVDGSGRVLDVAQEPADPDTLVIVDTTSQQLQIKDYVDSDALELARALTLRLPTELNFTPALIGWDIGVGVYVKSSAGQTIVFGQTDNLDRKLAFLKHLLEDGTVFTYLDLRPSNPYYRV